MTAKTVLITGASRGIGLSFVDHYKSKGWKVIAAVRNVDKADQLRALDPFKIMSLDVGDEASIADAAKELEGYPIDLLINNAGVYAHETLESATKTDIMRQFEINAVGPFLTTRALLNNLKLAADVHGIAKVASVSSFMGSIELHNSGGLYGYASSKAALNMMNKALSIDVKTFNIATVVLHPGYVATEINDYQGTIKPEEGVEGMVSVINDSVSIEKSGQFIQYTGDPLPW